MADDIKLAQRVYNKLKSAGRLNAVSLGFGVASNIEMAIVGGLPLEYEQGHNPGVNISHDIPCTGRLSFSIFPAGVIMMFVASSGKKGILLH